jgi:enoyl-CoA hydratase/carnithine racemase
MFDTGDKRIELGVDGHIATLRINRAEKLNALDYDMVLALERAALLADNETGVRAVILTGAGEKSFCAGGDIEAWSGWSAEDFAMKWVRQGHRAFDALARIRHPVIAAINGHCLGGGLELAVTADIRVAEAHAKLGQPESGIGVIPGWSGTQRAVRRFGAQVVRRMALAGEIFTAEQGLALGLVDKVVPKGEGLAAAQALAEQVAGRSPQATRLTKLMINVAEGEEREAAIETLGGYVAAGTADLKAGVEAFRNKRKPQF